MTECKEDKACSIILRGATKAVLNEIERNLHESFGFIKNFTPSFNSEIIGAGLGCRNFGLEISGTAGKIKRGLGVGATD